MKAKVVTVLKNSSWSFIVKTEKKILAKGNGFSSQMAAENAGKKAIEKLKFAPKYNDIQFVTGGVKINGAFYKKVSEIPQDIQLSVGMMKMEQIQDHLFKF